MPTLSSLAQDIDAEARGIVLIMNTISIAFTALSVYLLYARIRVLQPHSAPRPRDPLNIKLEQLEWLSGQLPFLQDLARGRDRDGDPISPATQDLLCKIIPEKIMV